MALWSSKWRSGAPPSAPPTSPRLLGTRFSPIAWELGLQEVADASTWEWQTASAVAASLIVLCTCLLLAAWAAMQCLARLLSRVAKAADDDAAAAEAVLLPPSHPRSQEDSGSDIECHSMPVGICAASNGKLPTSGALTTASIDARPVPLLPRNIQLPAPHCATPHCTTSGPTPLASVPAAPSLPATPAAARRSGEPARSPPSRKYLEAYCRAQSLTRPPLEAAASHNGAHNGASNHGAHNSASHNGAGAGSDGDPFGAPVFRQDRFGAPAFAPSGSNRGPVFAPSRAIGLPLVPPLLPRRLLPAPPPEAPPEAAAPYGASPQSGLSELPELSRELSGASPVSPRPYSPGGTATAGYSPPTFLGRTVGMHEGQDAVAGAFLPQIEFELSRLAREAAERVAPAVRVAKEEIAKHFEDIEEAAAAEAMAKEAVAEAVAEAAAEAAAEMAAEMAEVAVTQAVSRAAAAKAAAAEVAAAEKAAAEAAAHAEMEKAAAAAANRAAEKAAPAQAQRVAAEKAAAERRAKARSASAADEQTSRLPTARGSRSAPTARRASAAKAREKATAQPVAVAVPSPVRRAAAQQVLLAVRKRSLAAFDEIDLATLDLAIEQLQLDLATISQPQLDLATISQPQLDLATISWSEKSSPSRAQHGACACAPGSKESSSAKLSTVGSDWKC